MTFSAAITRCQPDQDLHALLDVPQVDDQTTQGVLQAADLPIGAELEASHFRSMSFKKIGMEVSVDYGPLIDSAVNKVNDIIQEQQQISKDKKARELQALLINRVTDYLANSSDFNRIKQELNVLENAQPPLENVLEHHVQIQGLVTQFREVAAKARSAAIAFRDKASPYHSKKYYEKKQIGLRDKNFLDRLHNEAVDLISITDNIDVEIQQKINLADQNIHFYSQTDSALRESLRGLSNENPEDYLFKVHWFQNKLLLSGQWAAAAELSKEWLGAVPSEARWKDVESMLYTSIFSQNQMYKGREGEEKILLEKLAEIRGLLGRWIENHQNLPSEDKVLAKGTLNYLEADTSLTAYQNYQECQKLRPEDPQWPLMQIKFDIETFQWIRAKNQFHLFPDEFVTAFQRQVIQSQQAIYSFGLDAGAYAFSKWLGPQLKKRGICEQTTVDLLNSGIRIAADPLVKDVVFKRLLVEYPIDPSKKTDWATGALAASVVGLVCTAAKEYLKPTARHKSNSALSKWLQNHERPIAIGTELTSIGARAFILAVATPDNPLSAATQFIAHQISPFAMEQLERMMGNRMSSATRTVTRTAQKIFADIPVMNLFSRGAGILGQFSKGCAMQFGAQAFAAPIESFCLKNLTWIMSPAKQCFAVTVYRIAVDAPHIRAAVTIGEMKRNYVKNNKQEVSRLKTEANSWLFGNSDAVAQYNDCLDFLDYVPRTSKMGEVELSRMNKLLTKVNNALRTFQKSEEYLEFSSDLLYQKIVYFLDLCELSNFETAKNIIRKEKFNTQLYARLTYFIISHAERYASQDLEKAENYLGSLQDLFPDPAYNNIIKAYKHYIAIRRAYPELTSNSTVDEINIWLRAIDSVRLLVNPIETLSHLKKSIQSNMLNQYIALKRYSNVAGLFQTFDDAILAEKYRACLDFFNYVPRVESDDGKTLRKMNDLLPSVNQVLEALKSNDHYSGVRNDLLYHKVVFFISSEDSSNHATAKRFLSLENSKPPLFARIVYFIISRAEELARQNFEKAECYLANLETVFPNRSFNDVITAYKNYISFRKGSLLRQNSVEAAIQAIETVRLCVTPIKVLSGLNTILQLTKLNTYIVAKKYREIAPIMQALGDTDAAGKYSACLELFDLPLDVKPGEDNKRERRIGAMLPQVTQALAALGKTQYYSDIQNELLFYYLALCLSGRSEQNRNAAKDILNRERGNQNIKQRLVDFIFFQAEKRQVTQFIEMSEGVFQDPVYDGMITAYKQFTSCKSRDPEAIIVAIDSLIEKMRAANMLSWLHESLLFSKFQHYVNTKKYKEAKAILQLPQISANTNLFIRDTFARYLISEGERLRLTKEADVAYHQIFALAQDFNIHENAALQSYLSVLMNLHRSVQEEDVTFLEMTVQSIDRLLEENESLADSLQTLNTTKINLLHKIGSLEKNFNHPVKAIQAFTRVKELLLKEGSVNQDFVNRISFLIRQVKQNSNLV